MREEESCLAPGQMLEHYLLYDGSVRDVAINYSLILLTAGVSSHQSVLSRPPALSCQSWPSLLPSLLSVLARPPALSSVSPGRASCQSWPGLLPSLLSVLVSMSARDEKSRSDTIRGRIGRSSLEAEKYPRQVSQPLSSS